MLDWRVRRGGFVYSQIRRLYLDVGSGRKGSTDGPGLENCRRARGHRNG